MVASSVEIKEEQRVKFFKTIMTPVLAKNDKSVLDYSLQELRLAVRDITEYLQSSQDDNLIETHKSD